MTPAAVHHGHATQLHAARAGVLDAAYAAHPERFVRKPPSHRNYRPPRGSTSRRRSPPLTKFESKASHRA